MKWRSWCIGGMSAILFFSSSVPLVAAPSAPFDLPGPRIEIKITRGDRTLPISQVPNLRPGDRLWLHPDVPEDESVHYLLIPVFLRGSLNPPPNDWFTKVETWHDDVRKSGVNIKVPKGAHEALLFWAPDTGGGFNTLRSAVRDRPGDFVRAAQDLYAADLTRSRFDAYIDAIKKISISQPNELQQRAKLLARTLYLKIDDTCFDLPEDQQEACLIQHPRNVVLNDAQSQSMVTALTSGSAGDIISKMSSSSAMGGGAYSPYIGAVVDLVRIMGNLHTAQYVYTPALAVTRDEVFSLKLSRPPTFSNPKSVMVSSLPPVAPVHFPALRAVHPEELLCLPRPSLVLSVEGAPLVFSTAYAHDLYLRVQDASKHVFNLPAAADPVMGGFLVDAEALQGKNLTGAVTGELRGEWGFDSYRGPKFVFTDSHPEDWTFVSGETDARTASDNITLHLQSASVVCVRKVDVRTPEGGVLKADWKPTPPRLLEVNLPLTKSSRGLYTLAVAQYGQQKSDTVPVHVYPPSAVITGVILHEGDSEVELKGKLLQEVASVEMDKVIFHPGKIHHQDKEETMRLATTTNTSGSKVLVSGALVTADVHLKDGRVLKIPVTVAPPRPRVKLLSKNIALNSSEAATLIHLGNDNDLPQSGRLTFFLKSVAPPDFPRDQKIEVAAIDGGFDTTLSLSDATLTLQDAQTVLAVLDPAKAFGPSAFGKLRFRPVTGAGVYGDWQALTNLVRLPSLKQVHCPADAAKSCTLTGENLFLIDSISNSERFSRPVNVPMGFAGASMQVPRPIGTILYLKLRDDPSTVDRVSLPVLPEADPY